MKPAKKFWKSLKKDVKNKKGILNAVRFTALFLACFLVFLYGAVPATAGFWQAIGIWHAQAAGSLLSAFDIQSSVNGNVITLDIGGEETGFVITQLCSGDIEVALLASLLLASFDVLLIWRVVGAALGTGFLLLANPLRIAITLWITKGSGMETGDFYHSLIFRLFLLVLLLCYYFAWYRAFATRKNNLCICKRLGL